MNDPFTFLISTICDLYLMVVILRIWMQLARADFYNPFSQFIVKATHPVIKPLRRVLPSVGNLDIASVVLALAVVVLKIVLITLIAGAGFDIVATLIYAVVSVIKQAGVLLFYLLIIRAILSWVSQGSNPFEYVLYQLTEPFLGPIRRFIPPIGGLDLSVLVLFILLNFLNLLLAQHVPYWAVA